MVVAGAGVLASHRDSHRDSPVEVTREAGERSRASRTNSVGIADLANQCVVAPVWDKAWDSVWVLVAPVEVNPESAMVRVTSTK